MQFLKQADTGKNEWWRYILTLMLMFFGWQFIGIVPMIVTAWFHTGNLSDFLEAAKSTFTNIGINSNLYLTVVIASFAFGLLFLTWGIIYIHQKKLISVLTSRKKIDWHRILFAFLLWFSISLLVVCIDYYAHPEDFVFNFKPLPFFTLLVVSFLFLPLQTSFEEVLFRGYLMQGFALIFKNALMPLILTSIVFGLLHFFNPEVGKLGPIIMVFYIGTGFLFGITTLMDEGTEIALGLHAANNIAAATLVSLEWTVFQTEALLIDTSEPSIGYEMALPVFVIYPVVLFIFSKKYQWKGWQQKLTGHIDYK